MAAENRDQSGFPLGSAAVALLFAIGIIVPQLELEPTRPTPSHVKRDYYPYLQNVPARLWEDPFEAATPEARTPDVPAGRAGTSKKSRNSLSKWITDEAGKDGVCLTIMPVTVFGGPFGEYSEVRRRTRYAVISALLWSGFEADDSENIGYIELDPRQGGTARALPKRIPFEWFERKSKKPADPLAAPRCAQAKVDSVLVLWLDEDTYEPEPIGSLDAVIEAIAPEGAKHLDRVRLIGPAGSRMLKNMVDELARTDSDSKRAAPWSRPFPLEIYAWGATASDADMARDTLLCYNMPRLFQKYDITLLRPIPDDRKLIERLIPELELRGVRLGADTIALVSESETFYGETLKEYICQQALPDRSATGIAGTKNRPIAFSNRCSDQSGEKIINFNYLRGLDGETARSAIAREEKRSPEKDATRSSGAPESAGLRQLDYVRRIAATLRERHNTLRAGGSIKGIEAIGVFGTDFYDKSLLLQALKREMPHALFFTTDLDARMTDANQSKWSRNLVVVSGFGLELRPELQGPTATFRDVYQTSVYLSTLLAANLGLAPAGDLRKAGSVRSAAIERLAPLLEARAYEIGRTEIFDFGPIRPRAALSQSVSPLFDQEIIGTAQASSAADQCTLDDIPGCATLSPGPSAFVRLSGSSGALLLPLLFFLAGGLVLATSWRSRAVTLDTVEALNKTWMAMLAIGCTTLAGLVMLAGLHDHMDGEPFRWSEGFSAWPTLTLRFVAILLTIYFLYKLWQEGAPDLEEALRAFSLPTDGGTHSRQVPWSLYGWIKENGRSAEPGRAAISAETVLGDYLVLASWPRRLLRVVPVVALYVLAGLGLTLIWDLPNAPLRGSGALMAHQILLILFVTLYTLLLFCVVDAVRLFEALIRNMMDAETEYPENTNKAFSNMLGMEKDKVARYADDWIDIQFIAKRTESTAKLVYYPFIILAIGLIARSQLFDNWHTPTSLAIIFLTGATYAAYSAYCLRNTAEGARAKALARMTRKLIAARGDPAISDKALKQLELLFEDIQNERRGAFLPLSQQPFWKALLLPLTSFGGVEILQYLLLIQK